MKKKRIISLMLAAASAASFTACGKKDEPSDNVSDSGAQAKNVTIRYLNFKPEIADAFEEVAASYKEETGNTLIVETAANNT